MGKYVELIGVVRVGRVIKVVTDSVYDENTESAKYKFRNTLNKMGCEVVEIYTAKQIDNMIARGLG